MPAKVALEHAARLAAHLSMQRELGKYCDVCVCVSDKKFLAHKCVLSANSSKLDALILDAIGQSSNSQDIEIEIQGVSPVGFEKLLEYFYVGELNLEPHTVMPVWMTAAYLELPDVVAMCNDYCQRSVTCVSNQNIDEASKQINSGSDTLQTSGTTVVISTLSPPNPGGSPTAVPVTETPGLQNENIKYNQLCGIAVPNKEPDLSQPEDGQITDEGAIAWTSLQTATGGEYHPTNNTPVEQNFYQTNDNQTSWGQNPTTYQNQATISKPAVQTYKMNQNQSSIIELNKLPGKINSDDRSECEDIMLEVERLRIQHQQLKRMQHQQQLGNNPVPFSVQQNITPAYSPSNNLQQNMSVDHQSAKKKAKRKKSSHSTDGEIDSSNSLIQYIPDHNQQQQQQQLIHHTIGNGVVGNQSPLISAQPPPDFRIVTPEYKDSLYFKHSKISKEPPMAASTSVTELLQRGKSRKRKSAEQNALNTTIRSILDTLEIVDSSDPKVEDALFLIMDRFESLREGINIPTVRRSLLVKVRHSIHCKKWRVKRQMLKADQTLHGMIQEDEFKEEDFHKLLKSHPNEDNLHG